MEQQRAEKCVLLFSGGRDSTLAAVRLNEAVSQLTLVTVTSKHLSGMEAVYRRLHELADVLNPPVTWYHVIQPDVRSDELLGSNCLPCHLAYTVVGASVARLVKADIVAFGYAQYQSSWLEQTPEATKALTEVLKNENLTLSLPVYDVDSKESAIAGLETKHLAGIALEQKCSLQQFHVPVSDAVARREIETWSSLLRRELGNSVRGNLQIVRKLSLKDKEWIDVGL